MNRVHSDEALRYYRNAKSILRNARVEHGRYLDMKPIREACGTAHLAVLEAMKGFLVHKGVSEEKLPRTWEEFVKTLHRYSERNGKLLSTVHLAYEILHRFGYYQGISDPEIIKRGFAHAHFIIEKLTGRSL